MLGIMRIISFYYGGGIREDIVAAATIGVAAKRLACILAHTNWTKEEWLHINYSDEC